MRVQESSRPFSIGQPVFVSHTGPMRFILRFLSSQILVVAVAAALLGALLAPAPGLHMRESGLVPVFIAAVFLFQGAGLHLAHLPSGRDTARVLGLGLFINQALAPALALLCAPLLRGVQDQAAGLILMACMGPTLVSGVVVAARVGGSRAVALVLAAGLNLLAVGIIPLTLRWTLGAAAALDAGALFGKLLLLVLLPALAGAALRHAAPRRVQRADRAIRLAPIVCLGMIIYASCSAHSHTLRGLDPAFILRVLLPALLLHILLLIAGYQLASRLLKAPRGTALSLAIVCSQKTLPIAIAVWSFSLADTLPLAIVPPILYHAAQILFDAAWFEWRRPAAG